MRQNVGAATRLSYNTTYCCVQALVQLGQLSEAAAAEATGLSPSVLAAGAAAAMSSDAAPPHLTAAQRNKLLQLLARWGPPFACAVPNVPRGSYVVYAILLTLADCASPLARASPAVCCGSGVCCRIDAGLAAACRAAPAAYLCKAAACRFDLCF